MGRIFKAPDRNVRAVIEKMTQRSLQGRETYGTTTERGDLSVEQWLAHLQAELMDGAVYIERLLWEMKHGSFDRNRDGGLPTAHPRSE